MPTPNEPKQKGEKKKNNKIVIYSMECEHLVFFFHSMVKDNISKYRAQLL